MIYTHVAVAIVSGAVAFGAAWRVQTWRHDSAELARVEQSRETEKMRRQAAGKAATQHEREKIVIREKFIPIREEVEHVITQVVYRDTICLPPEAVDLLNKAITVGNTGLPIGESLKAPSQ